MVYWQQCCNPGWLVNGYQLICTARNNLAESTFHQLHNRKCSRPGQWLADNANGAVGYFPLAPHVAQTTCTCSDSPSKLTSTPQRLVTNTFRLKARLPLLVRVAPSSLLEAVSSTDSPSCSRGLRQLSRQPSTPPTGHSAASTGLVMPPKTGKGSTFLQAARAAESGVAEAACYEVRGAARHAAADYVKAKARQRPWPLQHVALHMTFRRHPLPGSHSAPVLNCRSGGVVRYLAIQDDVLQVCRHVHHGVQGDRPIAMLFRCPNDDYVAAYIHAEL